MKLIDKDDLVAEIDNMLKIKEQTSHLDNDAFNSGRWKALKKVKDILNTLEVKEVELEKEIKNVQRGYKTIDEYENYPCTMYANDIEWIAKHFFELGLIA